MFTNHESVGSQIFAFLEDIIHTKRSNLGTPFGRLIGAWLDHPLQSGMLSSQDSALMGFLLGEIGSSFWYLITKSKCQTLTEATQGFQDFCFFLKFADFQMHLPIVGVHIVERSLILAKPQEKPEQSKQKKWHPPYSWLVVFYFFPFFHLFILFCYTK